MPTMTIKLTQAEAYERLTKSLADEYNIGRNSHMVFTWSPDNILTVEVTPKGPQNLSGWSAVGSFDEVDIPPFTIKDPSNG